MRSMQEAKKQYDDIQIPDELSDRIQEEIKNADKKRRISIFRKRLRSGMAAAAAAIILFTGALNTSTVFAKNAGNLPVIGAVARVLTFRSYETEDEDMKISVEIPSIEMISEDFNGLEKSVNEEILNLCQQYAKEAEQRAEEYHQAFLATGGTEEEWAAHNIEIKVWYEVKSQNEKYLSLAIMGTENWNSAHRETRYYNFDLESGKIVTLADLLGEGYKEKVNDEIRRQMEERKQQGAVYFDGFDGIDENTLFYLNEAGNPVIVFEPYEIAPGSEGQQEFEIRKEGITEGKNGQEAALKDLAALVGMKDEDTAELFGGGEENWTEDHSFYIGRIYHVDLYGQPCQVFTTCGNDKKVESVSIWIVGGERQVTEDEVKEWERRVSDMMGTDAVRDEEISEGGSQNYRWRTDGKAAAMNHMTDILTISFQLETGELK